MNSEISKIQIRQDTAENWKEVNPILARGELGYELPSTQFSYGAIKIGDGDRSWNELKYQTTAGEGIQDLTQADKKDTMYCREWKSGEGTKPEWIPFAMPEKDIRLNFADLMHQPYDTEIDMNYNYVAYDDVLKTTILHPVFALKKRIIVTQEAGIPNIEGVEIEKPIKYILQLGGTIKVDNFHYYPIPHYSSSHYIDINTDDTQERKIINIKSISDANRVEAPIDIWIIYAREN